MTESEWLNCDRLTTLVAFLIGKVSERKGRLLASAGCRLSLPLEGYEHGSTSIEALERYAEGRNKKADCPSLLILDRSESSFHGKDIPLLRDIFGNPFRPISINPIWLTPTVTTLATASYEERIMPSGELDPARLAVLSDALEEAGCDSPDILAHLRSPGPHVRGCWPVDLLLGKE